MKQLTHAIKSRGSGVKFTKDDARSSNAAPGDQMILHNQDITDWMSLRGLQIGLPKLYDWNLEATLLWKGMNLLKSYLSEFGISPDEPKLDPNGTSPNLIEGISADVIGIKNTDTLYDQFINGPNDIDTVRIRVVNTYSDDEVRIDTILNLINF